MNKQILSEPMSDGYGIIPRAVMRSRELTNDEKLVLAYILSMTGNGVYDPGCVDYFNMAIDLDIEELEIIRIIEGLIKKGWIYGI